MIKNTKFNKRSLINLSENHILDITDKIYNLNTNYLLDLNNSTKSLLEEFVINLANHQLLTFDSSLNLKDVYIEFSNECRTKIQDEHYKESGIKITPMICSYTFFNKSLVPLIITNIDFDKYKYKSFNDENDLILVFPNEFDHIFFEGNLYQGFQSIFNKETENPLALKINIYKKLPNGVEYYKSSNTTEMDETQNLLKIEFKSQQYHAEFVIDTTLINRKFMENVLYNKQPEFVDLSEVFLNYEKNIIIEASYHLQKNRNERQFTLPIEVVLFDYDFLFVIKSQKTPFLQTTFFLQLIDKYGYVVYDILDIYKQTISKTNRFYKEIIKKHFFSEYVCNWIISEINMINNESNVIIEIDKIPHLFRFLMNHFQQIIDFVISAYDLNGININITNILIAKNNTEYLYNLDKRHVLTVIVPLLKFDKYNAGDFIIFNTINSRKEDYEITPTTFLLFYLDFIWI